MARLVLETPLPPEECFRRIAERTESWSLLRWGATKSFLSKHSPPRFRLASPAFGRNPFRGIFFGRIVTSEGRTHVYGRLGLPMPGLLFFSLAIAVPVALAFPLFSSVPGLNRFEVQLVIYWALMFGVLRLIGAWDFGGPEDKYSRFLSEVLQSGGSPGPTPGHSNG